MEQKELDELRDRYLKGQCSQAEAAMLNSYFNQAAEQAGEGEAIADLEERKARVWRKIAPVSSKSIRMPQYLRYGGIAAAVATIVFGVWFFSRNDINIIEHSAGAKGDIGPGKYGATLRLSTGELIALDGSKKGLIVGEELKYDDGTLLSPTGRDGRSPVRVSVPMGEKSITASTSPGQTYEITLPDGSSVQLNAESAITFASDFQKQKTRLVKLRGEAYFIVKHNQQQPFQVESKGQLVEDIGTAFNISAYQEDAEVKTTLVEGSASVQPIGASGEKVVLVPDQQASFYKGKLGVKTIDVIEAIAWRQGFFRFNETKLADIMDQLKRWYNIEVVFSNPKLAEKTFSGRLSRSRNISQVLAMLEKTKGVHFKIEERRVTVIE